MCQCSPHTEVDVFLGGEAGVYLYRIPALIATPQGTLLAFCEARRSSGEDHGDIATVLKRSTDGGQTWSEMTVVWGDGNTCGNPCVVCDRDTGITWLAMTWNYRTDSQQMVMDAAGRDTRRPFVTSSHDDGRTWAAARDVTATAKHPEWRWYGTGPGVGIQLRYGPHAGRLLIPSNHSAPYPGNETGFACHMMYSDNHGETWRYGAAVGPNVGEPQAVQLAGGDVMINARNQGPTGRPYRAVAVSPDGGIVWGPLRYDPALTDPKCQASLIRYGEPAAGETGRLLFSHPAGTAPGGEGKLLREKLTVRLSNDEGKSWPVAKVVCPGRAAYSCLAPLPDGRIGILYEAGDYGKRIRFAAFPLEWLT